MTTFSELPDEVNWLIVQGDELKFIVQLSSTLDDGTEGPALDLTGMTVRAEVKVTPQQIRPTAIFGCTLLPQSGTTLGQVQLRLSPASTAKLPAGVACHYDMQTVIGTETKTRLTGTITASAETTRG